MTEISFVIFMLFVLVWVVVSYLLVGVNIIGALVFMVVGFVLGNSMWGLLVVDVDIFLIYLLAELMLAFLLFSDVLWVNVAKLRQDIFFLVWLLGIGLLLSIIIGSLLAVWMFDDFSWVFAGFVGASLAFIDVVLSVQVVNDWRIFMWLRRVFNVESGFNDGIATPIVVFILVVAASELGVSGYVAETKGGVLLELVVGLVVGFVVGFGSVVMIAFGSRRQWIVVGGWCLATLAAALASFALAVVFDGNGFIAAFVVGIVFGARLLEDVVDVEEVGELFELMGELMALVVWFLFGVALVLLVFDFISTVIFVYVLVSLTVVWMVLVVLSLVGIGLDMFMVLFVGWFGLRGLASVVFVLLVVEDLGGLLLVGQVVVVVAFIVLLSVVLHGVSVGLLGSRYVFVEGEVDVVGVFWVWRVVHMFEFG